MGFLSRLFGSGMAPRDLLADLAEDYRSEVQQAAHLRAHAERARYPQVATALRRLAEIEDRHAGWLGDRILALGGELPPVDPAPAGGNNQWARAGAALHGAQTKRQRLIEQITHWDPEEPEVVALLRKIEREDLHERPVYEGLIMRSDPQSLD
jgi:rubrerythrin